MSRDEHDPTRLPERSPTRLPTRLIDSGDRAGALLREAASLYSAGIDEPRAYARLVERRRGRARRVGPTWVLLTAGAFGAVCLIAWGRLHRLAPSADPVAWSTHLSDGTEIAATTGSDAKRLPTTVQAESVPGAAVVTISLTRGAVAVRARPARPAEDLRILAGPYRVEIAGDGVRVDADGERIGVTVNRGEARVWISTTLVRRVIAGERWSSPPAAPRAPVPAPEPSTVLFGPPASGDADRPETTKLKAPGHMHATRAPVETHTSLSATRATDVTSAGCLAEVRTGETREAEGCFARLAAGPSADAELALYELARLRHDALGDDAGAARALQEYGRRFPRGVLRTEAASSSFEVLSALGRYDEALAASRVALAESSGDQQARLRFLRGRVMQTHLRDCAGAINEYAAAERGLGPRRAEAVFYRGQCLEQLGRRDEAIGAYRAAAAAPDATTAIRAKARLEELAR